MSYGLTSLGERGLLRPRLVGSGWVPIKSLVEFAMCIQHNWPYRVCQWNLSRSLFPYCQQMPCLNLSSCLHKRYADIYLPCNALRHFLMLTDNPWSKFRPCPCLAQCVMDFERVGSSEISREQQVHPICIEIWLNDIPRSPVESINDPGIWIVHFWASLSPSKLIVASLFSQIHAERNAFLHS